MRAASSSQVILVFVGRIGSEISGDLWWRQTVAGFVAVRHVGSKKETTDKLQLTRRVLTKTGHAGGTRRKRGRARRYRVFGG